MKRKDVNSTVLMEQGLELIGFYRNNPSIAARDLLGVDFAPIQQVVFNDMWFKNYNISVMGRGGGKTFMLGTLATLSCMLYPGYRVGLIGPVNLMPFVTAMLRRNSFNCWKPLTNNVEGNQQRSLVKGTFND